MTESTETKKGLSQNAKDALMTLFIVLCIAGAVGLIVGGIVSCKESQDKRQHELRIIHTQNATTRDSMTLIHKKTADSMTLIYKKTADSMQMAHELEMINKGFIKKYPVDITKGYWEPKEKQ